MKGQFVCVCAQKSVELGSDRKLLRAQKDQQLRDVVQGLLPQPSVTEGDATHTCAFSAGGGVRIDGHNPLLSLASVDTCIAVFQGQLTNASELACKCSSDSSATAGSFAELLCRLYITHGVDVLSMLRGTFSFCLYESKTARVLATSDTSGAIELYEGRTAGGDLIVASSREYLDDCTEVVQFQPGDFKFGWHAMHRQYDPADFASDEHGRKLTHDGLPHHPHHGLGNGSTAQRRSSEHMSGRPSSAYKRTPSRSAGSSHPPSPANSTPERRPSQAHPRAPSSTSTGAPPFSRLSSRRTSRATTTSSCSSKSPSPPPPSSHVRWALDAGACPYVPSSAAAAASALTGSTSDAPAASIPAASKGADASVWKSSVAAAAASYHAAGPAAQSTGQRRSQQTNRHEVWVVKDRAGKVFGAPKQMVHA